VFQCRCRSERGVNSWKVERLTFTNLIHQGGEVKALFNLDIQQSHANDLKYILRRKGRNQRFKQFFVLGD
jgi:hypothetical protein